MPAIQLLVDRYGIVQVFRETLFVTLITNTDGNLFEPREYIEFVKGKTCESVDPSCLTHKRHIEPSATTGTSGSGPKFRTHPL